MRLLYFIPLFSLFFVGSLAADVNDSAQRARKKDVREMRYSRLKQQHRENLAKIERLKKKLQKQDEALEQEIVELKGLIMSQEEVISELLEKLNE